MISNFGKVERFFPEGLVFALAPKNPLALLPLIGEVGRTETSYHNISKVGETNSEEKGTNEAHTNQETDPLSKRKVPDYEGIQEQKSLKESLDLSVVKEEKLRSKIIRMLAKYAPMWKGRLDRMYATEHQIYLKLEEKPAHQMINRQGLSRPNKTAEAVREQPNAGFIETATSE